MNKDKRVIKEYISKEFFKIIYWTIQKDILKASDYFLSDSERDQLYDLFDSNREALIKKMDEYGYFCKSEVK